MKLIQQRILKKDGLKNKKVVPSNKRTTLIMRIE